MKNIDLKIPPWCPFCGQKIGRPVPPERRKLGEFSLGECECGAVYASDPTGFNVGAAMVETLVHACGGEWDLAWELVADDDYLSDRLEDYDEQTHQIVGTRNLDGRLIRGVLFFVRLQGNLQEIVDLKKGQGASPPEPAGIPVEPERDPKRVRRRADRKLVGELVEKGDIDSLVDLCFDDNRTIRFMQRLLYDPDEDKRWTVAHIMGKVYGRLSTRKPGMVSDLLHRLFEACADSASSSWGAVEAIGEIIAARPDIYGSFTRHLLGFLDDPAMKAQVLWAMGTIAERRPEIIRALPFYSLFGLVADPDPAVRAQLLRLLGRIGAAEAKSAIVRLADDTTPVIIHEQGKRVVTDLGRLAGEALARIDKQTKE